VNERERVSLDESHLNSPTLSLAERMSLVERERVSVAERVSLAERVNEFR
jgi:hypothetical protein